MVRDSAGRSVAVLAKSFPHAHLALVMEAKACRAGLIPDIIKGWVDLDIECDSSVLVVALNQEREDVSKIGCSISDFLRYLKIFPSFTVRHIFREANFVADRFAHLACCRVMDECWFEESLDIIQNVLY